MSRAAPPELRLPVDTIIAIAAEVRLALAPRTGPLDLLPLTHVARGVRIPGLAGPMSVIARGHMGLDEDTYAVTAISVADESACIWLHRLAWRELAIGTERTRFTVAHELMHCALHAEELDGLDVRAEDDHHDQLEAEANLAAAHLLIPDQALRRLAQQRGGLSQAAIVRRFGVGEVTAQRRLAEFMRTA